MKVEVKNGIGYCDGLVLRYKAPNIPDGRHECEYDKKLGCWVLSEPAEKEPAKESTGEISVKTDLHVLVKTIAELQTRVINAEHSLSCRESDIAELNEQIESLRQDHWENEIKELYEQLAEKDARIDELVQQLAVKDIQIEKLTEGINENFAIAEQKDERVYKLEQHLIAKEQEIEGHLHTIKVQQAYFPKREQMMHLIAVKDARIKELESNIADRIRQEEENDYWVYQDEIQTLKDTIVALAKKLVL